MSDRETLLKKLNLTKQKVARLSNTSRETVRNWLHYKKLRMQHEEWITDAIDEHARQMAESRRRLLKQ